MRLLALDAPGPAQNHTPQWGTWSRNHDECPHVGKSLAGDPAHQ